jgi:ATP-dependent DNA helicase RecG
VKACGDGAEQYAKLTTIDDIGRADMPTALETLVKILKLEREQGCENRAVIGGLAAYSITWKKQAQAQARRPEHHVLADEISDILSDYEHIESHVERMRQIDYMLDRIVGRVPMPPKYQEQLQQVRQAEEPDDDDDGYAPPELLRLQDKSRSNESYGYDTIQPIAARNLDLPVMPKLARPPRKPRPTLSLDEAKARLQELQQPVTRVKGIGASNAGDFAKLYIHTVEDMLHYLPRRYDDYTRLRYIRQLKAEEVVTVIGTVAHVEVRSGRNNRKDFYMRVDDGSGVLDVMFFGQQFLIRTIRKGQQVVVSGKTSAWRDRLQMSNPEWERLDSENLHTIGIVPVYPLTEGVTARAFRRLMKKTVDQYADYIPDHIPLATLERAELADINWTYKHLHFPQGDDHLHHARRRFIFDQLLTLQLGILTNRRDWQAVPGLALTVDDGWLDEFLSTVFPYELTGAQLRALQQIRADIAKETPMNRLLQGDVGAGKTAVAVAMMGMALQNRKQAALMAPTSILAEQHYRTIGTALENFPGDFRPVIALLTSALSTSERASIYRGMADGSIDVVIGTHALIQEGVEFKDLAVAIIDEQHRFGVEQRSALRGKGTNPHLLVMTATPIPRTLALTMYADLDLSILDEKPPGRQAVQTRLLSPAEREKAFHFIDAHVSEGRQAFIIHPLVEASDKVDARAAVEAYEELSQVFHRYRVCLLHGRMTPTEKDTVMAAFSRHEYDVMVTTSVAEVGVDVPNASVIVIEGANRFGLAQLHQFRGRVGRGAHRSFCLLIPDNLTEEAEERLHALEQTDDGFILAELDWKIRGAGDLMGTRQSGSFELQLSEFMTPDLVMLAQQEARTIYEEDPYLEHEEHQLLAEKVRLVLNKVGGDVS